MKFTVTFKTPDAVFYALQDLPSEDREEAQELTDKFVEFNEYVHIEFDTEAQTAKVVPQ